MFMINIQLMTLSILNIKVKWFAPLTQGSGVGLWEPEEGCYNYDVFVDILTTSALLLEKHRRLWSDSYSPQFNSINHFTVYLSFLAFENEKLNNPVMKQTSSPHKYDLIYFTFADPNV
jgi:hypothetical protein